MKKKNRKINLKFEEINNKKMQENEKNDRTANKNKKQNLRLKTQEECLVDM